MIMNRCKVVITVTNALQTTVTTIYTMAHPPTALGNFLRWQRHGCSGARIGSKVYARSYEIAPR